MRTTVFTVLALVAFAANSVLCRMALGEPTIDAASFSTIRILAGAITLWVILTWKTRGVPELTGSWASAAALCLYAIPFSFAYVGLDAGMGALILFGSVQMTMMGTALWIGERPNWLQWLGLALALGGLVYLLSPGISAPPAVSAGLMAVAGIGWGIYSLLGKGGSDPLASTTSNFVRSIPIAFVVSIVAIAQFELQSRGIILAVISGSVTSGLGYAIWYRALRDLTATRAAIVQLSVPIIAAVGGVIFLSESITVRLVVSSTVVLGGVFLAVLGRTKKQIHQTPAVEAGE